MAGSVGFTKNNTGVDSMTDKQYEKDEIKTRLDELSRVMEVTQDQSTIQWIEARKKELRDRLDTL